MPGSADQEASGPRVTSLDASSTILTLGQLDRFFAGRVTGDAYAIGIRFADLGTGWWVRPVDAFDPAVPTDRSFTIDYDVGGGIPPGIHTLRLVALDEQGAGGPFRDLDVCVVDDAVPDRLNACDPTSVPPAAVITLSWDEPVDLDLVIDTPTGKRVDHRHPTTAESIDGRPIPRETLADPHVGRLSRNSNAECVLDARSSESLVFDEDPPEGTYLAYASLFDACGRPSVTFSIAVYRREAQEDGTFRLVESERRIGQLTYLDARGGASEPTYVAAISFP